jgi:hypothetical protein
MNRGEVGMAIRGIRLDVHVRHEVEPILFLVYFLCVFFFGVKRSPIISISLRRIRVNAIERWLSHTQTHNRASGEGE